MKKVMVLICILFLSFVFVGCETEQDEVASDTADNEVTDSVDVDIAADNGLTDEAELPDGLFAVRSGIIEYQLSGSEEGTTIVYFDDYGKKSAEHKESSGPAGEQSTRSISLDGVIYVYDENNPAQGAKMDNPMIDILNELDEPDYDKVIETFYKDLDFERTGTENFLGKECILYESDIGKILTWKGILMLMDMTVEGINTRREVTSIETDIAVDSSYFELPAGIEFMEMPSF